MEVGHIGSGLEEEWRRGAGSIGGWGAAPERLFQQAPSLDGVETGSPQM